MKKATTGIVLLWLTAIPAGLFAQEPVDPVRAELALAEEIRLEELRNGPYSEALIDQYTALSVFYEEAGDSGLAYATIERALQVIRANYGLDSLEQVPAIRRLMAYEEEAGNAEAVWDYEQDLVGFANRNNDDLRAADIYRAVAERRLDILRRYDAGEYPPEIELGCYYDDTGRYNDVFRAGSRPLLAMESLDPRRANEPINQPSCRAGSQSSARRALVHEAQQYYMNAAIVMLGIEEHSTAELTDVLDAIARTSYRYGTLGIGRQSLLRRVAYTDENSEDVLERARAKVLLGDWDLMMSQTYGRAMSQAAAQSYREAYELLRDSAVDQAAIDEIFSPSVPVLVPSFVGNPLVTDEEESEAGYIDVSFVLAADGSTDEIEVLQASEDVSRSARRDLIRLIKRSRFRPQVTDGEFAEASPVELRYYTDE